jgi:tetratricopeptide (TPR) repeat protein
VARTRNPHAPGDTLEEIQHFTDRLVERVSANPRPVLAMLAGILLVAAVGGGVLQWRQSRSEAATEALEELRSEFVSAMGGSAGSLEVPEPANPETARSIRTDFAGRFALLAEEHAGTPPAALALAQVAELRLQLGETDAALEAWREASEAAADRPQLRGVLLERLGQAYEIGGQLPEAATAYEGAGDTSGYPLRYPALAQAARLWADAGEIDRALALYKRIRAESPETRLPEHLAARLRELEASPR